jgi:hypothetical protein
MDIKVTPGYEATDEEALKQMQQSRAFGLYLKRLASELERNREKCENADERVIVYRAQGSVSALRMASTLIETLIREAKGGVR